MENEQISKDIILKICSESATAKEYFKKERPELFEFKVGDYVKYTDTIGESRGYITHLDEKSYRCYSTKKYRLATPEEIKEHLIKEFWKKYKVGDKVKSMFGKNEFTLNNIGFEGYNQDDDFLSIINDGVFITIYQKGRWAEVVKEEKKGEAGKIMSGQLDNDGNPIWIEPPPILTTEEIIYLKGFVKNSQQKESLKSKLPVCTSAKY